MQYLLNLLSQGLLPETIFLNSVAVGIRKGFLFAASVNGLSIRGGGVTWWPLVNFAASGGGCSSSASGSGFMDMDLPHSLGTLEKERRREPPPVLGAWRGRSCEYGNLMFNRSLLNSTPALSTLLQFGINGLRSRQPALGADAWRLKLVNDQWCLHDSSSFRQSHIEKAVKDQCVGGLENQSYGSSRLHIILALQCC